MIGYKVVNYSEWKSLPEIFPTMKDAGIAKKKWVFGKNAIIEFFNYKNKRAKIIRGE